MPIHRKEIQQGKQGFPLKPQDKEIAICESAVQENLVGSWKTVCQTSIVDQGYKDH